jgi:hypothetical protein
LSNKNHFVMYQRAMQRLSTDLPKRGGNIVYTVTNKKNSDNSIP